MSAQHLESLETRTLNSASPAVVAYLPDYNATSEIIQKIDYSTVTEINYFSVIPDNSGNFDSSDSLQTAGGGGATIMKQAISAAHAHNDKINVVVGGAGYETAFENVFGSSTKRNTFAQSIAAFANKFGFDGIDLDYEVPGDRGALPSQVTNYGKLIAAVDNAIGNLKLSVAVQPDQVVEAVPHTVGGVQTRDEDGNLMWDEPLWGTNHWMLSPDAIPHLDRIGVMSYDYSPGAGNADETRALASMNNWINYATQNGGSRSQILLGLPFYGCSGPSDWGKEGPTGQARYRDILNGFSTNGTLPDASLTSCVSTVQDTGPSHQLDNIAATWYYDNPATIQDKTSKAVQANIGGVMVWDVTQDLYTAQANQQTGTFADDAHSLMPAIRRGLGLSSGPITPPPAQDSNTARILGTVFMDRNHNQVEDGSDTGRGGRVVFLDTNNNGILDSGETSTTINDNGDYEFDLLPAGTYTVRLQQAPWMVCTTPISQQVSLDVDQDMFHIDFGEAVAFR